MKNPRKVYDGIEVPANDPVTFMMPYVMPRRTDSEAYFDFRLDVSKVENFIREHQKDIPGLSIFHFIFAVIIRCCAITPQVNRFITGNRLYQREQVRIAMNIKKNLTVDGAETIIFPTFEKTESLKEIVEKTNQAAKEAMADLNNPDSDVDKLTNVLQKMPHFILSIFVKFMIHLDKKGKLPKALVNAQPFHSGFYVTNVGSIGLPVIYHHLYEFGTTSIFIAIGKKETETTMDCHGEISRTRILPIKMVMDERICDGFTFSRAYRTITRLFANPELLLESWKPE